MGSIEKNTQRNSKRFKVKKGVFMRVRGPLSLRCKIVDISRGGLVFIYDDTGNRLGKKVDLDILFKKKRFLVKNLSVRIISDSPILKKFIFFTFFKKRQCGAQFVGLIQNQAEQLEHLINNYTKG